MPSIVRLNIKENTFEKGSLAKQPWRGHSFDNPKDTRAYLLDKFFKGKCTWKPGDQVEAEVVTEAENGKFIYVVPRGAGTPAKKENAPAPVPAPVDDGYGEYVSPVAELVEDIPDDVTLFIAELKQLNQIIDRTAAYYNRNVTKISLKHRAAKIKLEKRMDGWKVNIRLVREMGGNEVMVNDLEDRLSADGRELKALSDRMLGEIHRMVWTFIQQESVYKDLDHLSASEKMFDQDKFDTRTGTSYPFILWMYSHKQYPQSENAWKFLNEIEGIRINDALGQKTLGE